MAKFMQAGQVYDHTSRILNNSFIWGVIKIICSAYLLVFFYEIFKSFEEKLYRKVDKK